MNIMKITYVFDQNMPYCSQEERNEIVKSNLGSLVLCVCSCVFVTLPYVP